jgi:starvation-inducible DNA-binding protein
MSAQTSTSTDAPDSGTAVTGPSPVRTTVPGLDESTAAELIARMQERLVALLDLQLTLKHIHWNVVGMNFIAVHEMLDPQVDAVRSMSDEVAERIATLGGEPLGTPGAITALRRWDDYALNREPVVRHLSALDDVYSGVIADHRAAIEHFGGIDPITEDLFIGHTRDLELFQWFVRAHLKDAEGDVVFRNAGDRSEASRGVSGDGPTR